MIKDDNNSNIIFKPDDIATKARICTAQKELVKATKAYRKEYERFMADLPLTLTHTDIRDIKGAIFRAETQDRKLEDAYDRLTLASRIYAALSGNVVSIAM